MGRRSSKCFVHQCQSNNKNQNICLFGAPKDEELLKQWNMAIGRDDKQLSLKDVVCELHFSPDDIIREWKTRTVTHTYAKPKLKNGAVPCVFPFGNEIKSIVDKPNSGKKRKMEPDDKCNNSLENCDTYPPIFQNLYERQVIPTLPASWTYCPYSNEDGKYVIFTENAVHEHKPVVTRQVLMTEQNRLNFFHNFNQLNATVLNLKDRITNLNELDDILSRFKLLKCCPGGPDKDQFEVTYNHISFVDAKTQKWRHKKCSYMIFANDIICNFCKYLCDINVFKYSEKKTRKKEDNKRARLKK